LFFTSIHLRYAYGGIFLSEESESVFVCPHCGQPARNPECEDLGKKYFGGGEKDGTNRS